MPSLPESFMTHSMVDVHSEKKEKDRDVSCHNWPMDMQYRRAETDTPHGTVLLAHGYAEHSGRFQPLHDALVAAGYDIAFYDHYGHGTAPGPRACVDVGRLITAHLNARRIVLTHSRTENLFLFGHSMGGLISAASCLLDPHHLRGVVLTSPAFRPLPPVPVKVARALLHLARIAPQLSAHPAHTPGSPSALSRNPHVQENFDEDPLTHKGPVPILTGATMIIQGSRVLEHAERAQTPTLIFHGSADTLASLAGSRTFVRNATAAHPDADIHLRIIDGAYHEVLNEPEGPGLIRDIVMWLDAH